MFLSTLIIFALIISGCSATEKRHRLNVGTVLFRECDTVKECWSCEDIALLTSKMLLEDVLPKRDVLVIQENAFIIDIIDYFRIVLEVVRRLTSGKTKHIMLLALTDTLGGYLYRYVIPTAKQAYYAGFINFESTEKLLELFSELKSFLRTNGHGWARPVITFSRKMLPQPLPPPTPSPRSTACKGLMYIDNSVDSVAHKCRIAIPMPFFDSKKNPSAIAVPFKTYSLRNIGSKAASYILVKYYTASTKCLLAHNCNRSGMAEFNDDFYSWINVQVLPRLLDEKFYSAFGGILRVDETLKKIGARLSDKKIGNYNIMPETQLQEFGKDTFKEPVGKQRKKSDLILMALLATIFVWFLLGSLFICYRIRAAKSRKDPQKNEVHVAAVIVNKPENEKRKPGQRKANSDTESASGESTSEAGVGKKRRIQTNTNDSGSLEGKQYKENTQYREDTQYGKGTPSKKPNAKYSSAGDSGSLEAKQYKENTQYREDTQYGKSTPSKKPNAKYTGVADSGRLQGNQYKENAQYSEDTQYGKGTPSKKPNAKYSSAGDTGSMEGKQYTENAQYREDTQYRKGTKSKKPNAKYSSVAGTRSPTGPENSSSSKNTTSSERSPTASQRRAKPKTIAAYPSTMKWSNQSDKQSSQSYQSNQSKSKSVQSGTRPGKYGDSGDSIASLCSVCSLKQSRSSTKSGSVNESCICNVALVGNLHMSSVEDISLRNNQLVFGYDMESSSSPDSGRVECYCSEEMEEYGAGNMSK